MSQISLGDKLLSGAVWMVAMRWLIRLLGLLNTFILVRLLTPTDFGTVAMAMIVVAFMQALNDMGLDMALIRTPELTEEHYHSAWTLTFLLGLLNSLILLGLAPFAAEFYEKPELLLILQIMAILPVMNGMNNIRLADFRRELKFKKEFTYNVMSRIIAFPISISLALYFRNYWALVAGMLIHQFVMLCMGYIVRPFRPRICFNKFKELFGFSIWVQVRSLGNTIAQRIDQLYIGKMLGASELGGYQVSQDITNMATDELILPVGRALLPGYAKIQQDQEALRAFFYNVFSISMILSLALGGGLFAISADLVPALLGESWVIFTNTFQILALASGLNGITSATGPILVALGKVKVLAISVWCRTLLSVLALSMVLASSGGLVTISLARLAVTISLLIGLLTVTLISIRGRWQDALRPLPRAILSTLLMIMAVFTLQDSGLFNIWIRLILEVILGGSVFLGTLFGLWWCSGCPNSVEQLILTRLRVWIIPSKA